MLATLETQRLEAVVRSKEAQVAMQQVVDRLVAGSRPLVYQVRVFVQNPHEELRLGMPAVVTIPLNQSHSTDAEAETKTNEGS